LEVKAVKPCRDGVIEELVESACRLGASDARALSVSDISVEDTLANLCREPECENYGLSAGCPPNVSGPSGFRELLKTVEQVVFFKIDVPWEILLSNERRDIFRLLHEVAAGIEQTAVERGYPDSKAFAGGSCKQIFCYNHPLCRVLEKGEPCRNSRIARPSMSGFGINVSKLMKAAGWPMNWTTRAGQENTTSMGTVCGLVVIG
jgi:predicted metal-binding protein